MAAFATQGTGHREEERILSLLEPLGPVAWGFDRTSKRREVLRLLRRGLRERPDLVVMEGTGLAGAVAILALRGLRGVPYVVSSGDAVGPFLAARYRLLRPVTMLYERRLYRHSAGVIGWTPYIAGRAITFGAPRAMSAANWSPGTATDREGQAVRAALGIRPDDIVFGIVGSLDWNERVGYCYGSELVRAIARMERDDVKVVVVGDGSGVDRLKALAGDRLGTSVLLPGRVPREDVQAYLRAFDVGSLPQSTDAVGAMRYTTKLSEYLAAELPTVTGQLPFAYEFLGPWLVRLPGDAPWELEYVDALADLMRTATRQQLADMRAAVPVHSPTFAQARQVEQACAFVLDVIGRSAR